MASHAGVVRSGAQVTTLTIASTVRRCNGCTKCCEGSLRLPAKINGHDIEPGKPCRFRSAGGCTIYSERPDVCRSYMCGWLVPGSPFPDEYRPDKLGVMFLPRSWRGQPVYRAI